MSDVDAPASNIRNFVYKLDHPQEEVRFRALDNIINKLNYGILSAIDLAYDHTLISKLLHWFQRPSAGKEKECLQLIQKICSEEAGCQSVSSLGGTQYLQSLKSDSLPEPQAIIDSILERIYISCVDVTRPDSATTQLVYNRPETNQRPPGQPSTDNQRYSSLGSTKSPRLAQQSNETQRIRQSNPAANNQSSSNIRPQSTNESHSVTKQDWYSNVDQGDSNGAGFLVVEFPWITLCSTDVHVLESTNQSLVSQDPQLILSACEFLVDVMLFDFPAEIFLQRPLIMKTLIKLLSSLTDTHKVSDVSLAVVDTLSRICDAIKCRITFHKDPTTFAPKQDILGLNPLTAVNAESVSNSSTNSQSSHYSRPSVIGVSDELDEDRTQSTSLSSEGHKTKSSHRSVSVQMTTPNMEEIQLQDLQLLLPDLCLHLHKAAVTQMEKCNSRLELELHRLVIKLQSVLKLSINEGVWYDNSQYANELCEMLRQQLSSMARVALRSHQTASPSSQMPAGLTAHKRVSYILLSQFSLDLYALVPNQKYSEVLGGNERQLLYTLCCDESLAQSLPSIRQRAAEVLQLIDQASYDIYKAATVICNSIDMYCTFLLSADCAGKDARELLKTISQVDKAVYSIPYHMNTELIPAYVKLCALGWRSLEGQSEDGRDYMINTLLKYMAHPLPDIKKITYQSLISLLKSCLSFDVPTQNRADDMRFLTHHSLLWEVACFGLSSDIPEVISCSQDLFNYLMQCRMLVSTELWKLVCNSLLPILPILQSYASQDLTIGKCVLALIDPHFDTNISTPHCVKGAIRILFTRDSAARVQATKVLMSKLNSQYSSHLLYPLTETKHYENHMVHMESLIRATSADGSQRSVMNEDSVTRVLRVFLADGVEPGVRLTSLNQLALILQNPSTHKYYLDKDGLEITLRTIRDSVSPQQCTDADEEAIAPAVSILACLLQHSSDLRQALAVDVRSMLTLLRCCWMFPTSSRTSIEAAQCLTYILFNEVSPKSSSSTLSLPKSCCIRVESPPTSSDPLMQPLPLQMLRVYWNVMWHGKVENLLDSLDTDQVHSGSEKFRLSAGDISCVKGSNTLYSIFNSLRTISNATSHNDVAQQLGTLTAYSLVCSQDSDQRSLSTITWSTYFSRFLMVQPVAPMDKELLIRIINYFTTLLSLQMDRVSSNLLKELECALQASKDSVLLSLLHDSTFSQATDSHLKRPLQNSLLSILSVAGLERSSAEGCVVGRSGRCYLVRGVLKRLTMADASNFYNLASLESSVYTLLRLTSSPGWSVGCNDIDSSGLCSQLVNALFEVLSAFHLGRQGNSSSYMGKGVLRNATLCLRHVVEEITSVVKDTDSWLTPWIAGSEGQTRIQWLRSLWTYRDQEVRAAALGVSVALVHSSLGLDTVSHSIIDMIRDAAEIVVDSTECSLVRRQASVLLSNLVSNIFHHPNAEYNGKKDLMNVYEVLQSVNYFTEIFTIFSSDVFLDTELNIDSLHRQIRPELGESVCNVVYPTLATPSFLSSVLQCLVLLSNSIPAVTLNGLKEVDAVYHLIGFFMNNGTAVAALIHNSSITDQSKHMLRRDVITLCADIIALLRSCVIQNKHMRDMSLSTDSQRHVGDILSVLSAHTPEGEMSLHRELIVVWRELFQYLTAHLHLDDNCVVIDTLLNNLVEYWQPITDVSLHVLKMEGEESRVCVLEFWTMVLSLFYTHKQVHVLTELLDGNSSDKDSKSYGSSLYSCMLDIYDSLLLRYTDKECIQERLAVINCMKSLLALSQSAKLSALQAGFAETLLSHLNSFIGKLNLLATHKLGALTEGNVYIAELVVTLEVLTNFMSGFDEGKRALSLGGLANLTHRMWFYCESDSQLMGTCISMLTTYTENSTLACRHLVCTSTVSCLGMSTEKLQIQSNSLADILVKLTQSQLNKMHINIELLSKLFKLMSNFALAPDTLSVICKNTLVSGLVSYNPKVTIKRKPKLQAMLIKLWIQLYLNLSYSMEGLQLILTVPDGVRFLVEQLSNVEPQSKHRLLIILYNLCVGFRSKILTSDCVPLTAVGLLEDSNSPQTIVDCAVEILRALVYDSMKGKAVVKGLNIPERLEELINGYTQEQMKYTSGRQTGRDRQPLIDSIQQILVTIKE